MFTESDIKTLKERGISKKLAEQQIEQITTGTRFLTLNAPAIGNNGIIIPENDELNEWVDIFNREKNNFSLLKFVPASGAASRMFKRLLAVAGNGKEQILNDILLDGDPYSPGTTLRLIDRFAFADELAEKLQTDTQKLSDAVNENNWSKLLDYMLSDKGLNLANKPKGLIPFHRYTNEIRTPFEEHLAEGAAYARSEDGKVSIHFTVSPEHKKGFENLLDRVRDMYEKMYKIHLEVSFSVQSPATDTLAVNNKNKPFRNADGSLLFRPGGHGALIENLNQLNQDIVFIKNIDNVVPERLSKDTNRYKKALSGLLMSLRKTVHEFLYQCERKMPSQQEVDAMIEFVQAALHLTWEHQDLNLEQTVKTLQQLLHRPIRVCGMVKNTGEPGGGPFWVKDADGKLSLQIVEKAQINLENEQQKAIFEQATHFNPVDLVCSLTDYNGKSFNLLQFRDDNAYFVADKTKDGKELKALELPGLWNGAMAHWITVFVEVPLSTFNPVKEVNDLLRPEHQPETE